MTAARQYCQWPGLMLVGADCRWPQRQPSWSVESAPALFSTVRFAAQIDQALDVWRGVADVDPVRRDQGGQIRVGARWIDGPGGVLGQSTLPCPQPVSYVSTELDSSERWSDVLPLQPGEIDVITVLAHELGHAIGLGHNEPGNIMAAAYVGPRRVPGAGDVRDVVARYGATRRPRPPGDPGPLPPIPSPPRPRPPGGPMPIPPDAWAILIQALIAFLRRIFGIPGVPEALAQSLAEAVEHSERK